MQITISEEIKPSGGRLRYIQKEHKINHSMNLVDISVSRMLEDWFFFFPKQKEPRYNQHRLWELQKIYSYVLQIESFAKSRCEMWESLADFQG